MTGRARVFHLRDSRGLHGAERVILTLARNMDRERFEPVLLCLEGEGSDGSALAAEARRLGVEVLAVRVRGRLDPAAVGRVRRLVRQGGAALVHSHDFKSDFYALAATAGTGIRRVLTAHGSTRDSLRKKMYLAFTERLVYRFCDLVIAVSRQEGRRLEAAGVGASRLAVVPNGLDPELIGAGAGGVEPLEVPEGVRVFACVGRLFPDKGQHVFLEAFARLGEAGAGSLALVVGDGPSRGELERLAEARGLGGRVRFAGERRDMRSVYARADFLVIPSLREGLPYVLLEAMACGVPVLATAVGDVPELVRDGETGRLVPPGDAAALCQGLRSLLADGEGARAMAGRARSLVRERYSAAAMAGATERLYERLLAGPGERGRG